MHHFRLPPVPTPALPRIAPRLEGRRRPRLDWGALAAGLAVTGAVQLALSLFGAALGLSVAGTHPLWGTVVLAISLYVGGTTTGHTAGARRPKRGTLHGVVLWALATLLARWLTDSDQSAGIASPGVGAAQVAHDAPGTLWLSLLGLGVGITAAIAGVRGWLRR